MLFTERKALEIMFSNLEDEKKQKRTEYRKDIEVIEERQMNILDRIQRLDNVEREAVDAEGLLREFSTITKELGSLIPQVSAKDVIEKAAEKIVSDPVSREQVIIEPEKDILRENISKAATMQMLNSKPASKPASPPKKPKLRFSPEEGIKILQEILKDSGGELKLKTLSKRFTQRTGREYSDVAAVFRKWAEDSNGSIIKDGNTYRISKTPDIKLISSN